MNILNRIKNWVRTKQSLKPLYVRCAYIKNRIVHSQDYRFLQERGPKVISFIQNVLEEKAFFYFDSGTLLGIVRDGRLLKYDNDIDVAVLPDERGIERIREILLSAGCKRERSYFIDGIGVVEDVFSVFDFRFDVFYIYKGEEKYFYYAMYMGPEAIASSDSHKLNVVKLYFSPITHVKKIEFNNMLINIPENTESYLQEKYGVNWRIPDKYFAYYDAPNAEKIHLMGIFQDN